MAAWREGKNPYVSVKNPNILETAKRFIRVRANSVWGNPKELFGAR